LISCPRRLGAQLELWSELILAATKKGGLLDKPPGDQRVEKYKIDQSRRPPPWRAMINLRMKMKRLM
jgi:hypothetical protein